jgi:hypothetical protein
MAGNSERDIEEVNRVQIAEDLSYRCSTDFHSVATIAIKGSKEPRMKHR